MDERYEQLKFDVTLESDRTLKDNIQEVASFALKQLMEDKAPSDIKNRHEGYGVVAESHSLLKNAEKAVDTEMKSLLALLPNGETEFIQLCGSLYNAAIDTAMQAIRLAADAKRVLADLYDGSARTPIEEAIDEAEENDGFEDVEDADPEDEEEEE